MPETTLTINHAGGGSETYTINRDKFEGIRNMTRKLSETAGDPENITAFTTSGSSNVTLNGTFTLNASGWQKPSGDGYIRYFRDINNNYNWYYRDYDGEEGSNTVISADDVTYPWEITNWLVDQPTFGSFVGGSIGSTVTDTVSVDHTPPEDLRNLLIDAENITINRDKGEEFRTLFIDGVEVVIDRTGEIIVQRFLDLFTGAAAAYSLQSLKRTSDQALINIRRGSDNVEVDVYPDRTNNREVSASSPITVTSGSSSATTFGEFLAEAASQDTHEFHSSETAFRFHQARVTSTSSDLTGFTMDVHTAAAYAGVQFASNVAQGDSVYVYFNCSFDAGSPSFKVALRDVTTSLGGTLSSSEGLVVEGFNAFELTSTNSSANGLVFSEGDDNVKCTISDLVVSSVSRDAFVTTWYEQAGSNDASQPLDDAQPKIAENGSVLTDGIKFDGVNDMLQTGTTIIDQTRDGTISQFGVVNVASDEAGYLWGSVGDSVTLGTSVYARNESKFALANGKNPTLDTINRGGGEELVSTCYSSNSANLRVNGAGTQTSVGGYNFIVNDEFTIGNRESGTASATFLNGSIKEIIVFNSDQSANRADIEANINGRYSIY